MGAEEENKADAAGLDPPHCASCGKPLPYGDGMTLSCRRALCYSCYQHPRDYWSRVHPPKESEE